ncbi:hypothetical protein ACTQZK_06530 [Paraeggerthella sp. LCP19S3_G8]|uniref:hypothetical protein n=1 Tax=Paraeggerthella sp. LCP19S3_G8 TaxID=3440248 RepID=UPI002A8D2AEE|nr:hypothetical protein [Paraeggerthella sp.]
MECKAKRGYEVVAFVTGVDMTSIFVKKTRSVIERLSAMSVIVKCTTDNGNEIEFPCSRYDAPQLGSKVRLSVSWDEID